MRRLWSPGLPVLVSFSISRQTSNIFGGFEGLVAYVPVTKPWQIQYTHSQNLPPLSSEGSQRCSAKFEAISPNVSSSGSRKPFGIAANNLLGSKLNFLQSP